MSTSEPPQPSHASPAAAHALAERQMRVLERLADAGLATAVGLERRAEDPASDAGALALAYSRISRAVRLTLALQTKLTAEAVDLAKAEAERDEAMRQTKARAARSRDEDRRDRLDLVLRRVIATEHDDEDAVDRLTGEAWERLDDEDICGALLERPFAEIVGRICRDLGLSPDWARLEGEAWTREGAGEPLASADILRPVDSRTRGPPAPPEGPHVSFGADLKSSPFGAGASPAYHARGP